MSTPAPTDFRGYLLGANAVRAPDIPDRPNHANFINACLQEGLTDAAKGVYDKHSFASEVPMTFERRCSNWLGFALSKAMDRRHDDLYSARDIIARTQAAAVEVQGKRIQAEADLQEIEQQIEQARTPLTNPEDPLYERLADVLSEPDPVGAEDSAGGNTGKAPSFWSQMANDAWTSVREQWKRKFLWLALVAGEIGLIFAITQQLGDGETTGAFVALSISALAVGVGWLAIPTLLERRAPHSRKVISSIALGLFVITMLALGWLRYASMRPEVVTILEDSANDPGLIVAIPWYGDLLFYLLWVALPLALTVAIALLETHRFNDREPVAEDSSTSDSNGLRISKQYDAGIASFRAAQRSDHRINRARIQLVSYLKDLKSRRNHLQDRIIALRAEEAHALIAQEDVKLNESGLTERTRLYLQSLPEMIGEGFICYLNGLERGLGDPTMTAHVQEAADAFLLRYMETAQMKVNEYLVYLNANPIPEPAAHVGEL